MLNMFLFSLRYVNVVTQCLVLTALAAVCIVSPLGHMYVELIVFGSDFSVNCAICAEMKQKKRQLRKSSRVTTLNFWYHVGLCGRLIFCSSLHSSLLTP